MSGPDERPEPLLAAINAATAQLHRVWQLAATEGFRHGLEAAARICEAVGQSTRNKPDGLSDQDIAAVATSDFLRDKIREFALTVDDPPVEGE